MEKQPTGRGQGAAMKMDRRLRSSSVTSRPTFLPPQRARVPGLLESGAGCALLAPSRRSILIATKGMLFRGQDTRLRCIDSFADRA